MKLTLARMSRYLVKQKKLNDYLLKVTEKKDREALILLSAARSNLLEGEKALRNLTEYLTRGR